MSDSSRHEKAQKLVRTWLTHCQHLSGDALSLPHGSGVCAEYALEKLLELYDGNITDVDVRQNAGVLMDLCKSKLSGGLGYQATSMEGLREVLELGLKTFQKADRLDRSGNADYSVIRRMYFNAWEFLGVVAHGMAQRQRKAEWSAPEWCDMNDIKGKMRYSMWRATEIWKAERENREPVAPPALDDGQGFEEWLMAEETASQADKRHCREFFEGQKVLYSESGMSHSKAPGTVVRVQWTQDKMVECDVRLDGDGSIVRKVRNEYLSPLIHVKDEVCITGGSVKAKVEDVNDSVWPPRYLVLTSSQSLEEVEDDDVYFEIEKDQSTTVSVQSSDDEKRDTIENWESSSSESFSSHDSHIETQEREFPEPPQTQPAVLPQSPVNSEPIPSPVVPQDTNVSKRYKDDIKTLCKGEKLCKSALSAISFGDAATAVKYLQMALEALQIENNNK